MYMEVREENKWREGWGKKEGNDGKRKMPCVHGHGICVECSISLDGSTWSQWKCSQVHGKWREPFQNLEYIVMIVVEREEMEGREERPPYKRTIGY